MSKRSNEDLLSVTKPAALRRNTKAVNMRIKREGKLKYILYTFHYLIIITSIRIYKHTAM